MGHEQNIFEEAVHQFVEKSLQSKDYELIPLAGDASARRYGRVINGEDSYVLMVWEPFEDNADYPFLSVLKHFSKHGVNVPKVIDKSPEAGLILLEDLGDLTLERKFWENQDQSLVIPYYKKAIDEIIKVHYLCSQDKSPCTAFEISFDTEKLLWEMNYGREHLIEKFCQVKLSETERNALQDNFTAICSLLDKQPKFICHRDYHSRNLMLLRNKMRVIDFQDARMGPIQYDLVSLVHDSYVDLNETSINLILQYYFDRANEYRKDPLSKDEFFEVFELQILQRCFKACGSFASFYNMRQDSRYLKYLEGTLTKVSECLKTFPEYSDFLNIIKDKGLLEKKFEV